MGLNTEGTALYPCVLHCTVNLCNPSLLQPSWVCSLYICGVQLWTLQEQINGQSEAVYLPLSVNNKQP